MEDMQKYDCLTTACLPDRTEEQRVLHAGSHYASGDLTEELYFANIRMHFL